MAEQKGIRVYRLNIGDPDLPPHQVFRDALIELHDRFLVPYAESRGENRLREGLLRYYRQSGLLNLGTENIQVTCGASEAILWAFSITVNMGEEILLFEPFYSNYTAFARQTGAQLVPIPTRQQNGFHLPSTDEIQKRISRRTRAICLCNPNNPTGVVLTEEEMVRILEIAKHHELWLLVDETYRELVYDGRKPYSFLQFSDYDGIVVLESLSKTFSLCGLRIGALISRNSKFIEAAFKYSQARLGAGFLDQQIGANIIKLPKQYFEARRREYQDRRDVAYNLVTQIEGVSCVKPEGGFYLLLQLPIDDSEDFAKWLLTSFHLNGETVLVTPAAGFYGSNGRGRNEIRIAYVINQEDLAKAIRILAKALPAYQVSSSKTLAAVSR
jgi:aspartate aminotransferase